MIMGNLEELDFKIKNRIITHNDIYDVVEMQKITQSLKRKLLGYIVLNFLTLGFFKEKIKHNVDSLVSNKVKEIENCIKQ